MVVLAHPLWLRQLSKIKPRAKQLGSAADAITKDLFITSDETSEQRLFFFLQINNFMVGFCQNQASSAACCSDADRFKENTWGKIKELFIFLCFKFCFMHLIKMTELYTHNWKKQDVNLRVYSHCFHTSSPCPVQSNILWTDAEKLEIKAERLLCCDHLFRPNLIISHTTGKRKRWQKLWREKLQLSV